MDVALYEIKAHSELNERKMWLSLVTHYLEREVQAAKTEGISVKYLLSRSLYHTSTFMFFVGVALFRTVAVSARQFIKSNPR